LYVKINKNFLSVAWNPFAQGLETAGMTRVFVKSYCDLQYVDKLQKISAEAKTSWWKFWFAVKNAFHLHHAARTV